MGRPSNGCHRQRSIKQKQTTMPLTVQYASDLHLEFAANRSYLDENPILPVGEVLVLCGDIVPFAIMDKHARFFDYISDNFTAAYWMPGNHEYYGVDAQRVSGPLFKEIKHNVFLVNNTTAVHKEVTLIFSTLWSHIKPTNEQQVAQQLNDFDMIQYNGGPLTVEHYNQMHQGDLGFITSALELCKGKTLVCSHHAPTFTNYPDSYKNHALQNALGTELKGFIEKAAPDGWVYGHHHTNIPDFFIGKTLMATNQVGYVQYQQHTRFSAGKCITV
jgi:predicted phosphohydrolase